MRTQNWRMIWIGHFKNWEITMIEGWGLAAAAGVCCARFGSWRICFLLKAQNQQQRHKRPHSNKASVRKMSMFNTASRLPRHQIQQTRARRTCWAVFTESVA